MGFDEDFGWQAQFLPTICRIVGPHLLVPTPESIDQTEAADFMLLRGGEIFVAARVRRCHYIEKYGKEITIRSRRDTGARTEWEKICEDGFGDWMFYGFHTGDGLDICPFFLLDLHVLRDLWRAFGSEIITVPHIPNGDGTYFHAIRPGLLVRPPFSRPDLVLAWEQGEQADAQTKLFDKSRRRAA